MEKRSPDITQCHASRLGAGDLVFCRSEHRAGCDYALPFGIRYFCLHPQSGDIAAGTAAPQGGDHDEPSP